jgi:hypothetical protein
MFEKTHGSARLKKKKYGYYFLGEEMLIFGRQISASCL